MRYAVACVLLVLCGACLAADTQPATKPKPTWFEQFVAKIPEKLIVKESDEREDAIDKQRLYRIWWREQMAKPTPIKFTGKLLEVKRTTRKGEKCIYTIIEAPQAERDGSTFRFSVMTVHPLAKLESMEAMINKPVIVDGSATAGNGEASTPKRFIYNMTMEFINPKVTVKEEDKAAAR